MYVTIIKTIQFQMLQNLQEQQRIVETPNIKYVLTNHMFMFDYTYNG